MSIPPILMSVDIGETTALPVNYAMNRSMQDIALTGEVSFLVEVIVSNIALKDRARICSSTFRACLSKFDNRCLGGEVELEYVDVNTQNESDNKQN
jgi:hypothetical protein